MSMSTRSRGVQRRVGQIPRALPARPPAARAVGAGLASMPELSEVALPQGEDLRPARLGGERLVVLALGKGKAVMRSREGLEGVSRAGLVERRLERRNDMVRHRRIDFGEAVVKLALDSVDGEMRRVRFVGDDVDAVERR